MSRKNNIMDWLTTGTKHEVLIRKILVVSLAILAVYQLGYNIGEFLAHIGL